LAAVVVAPASPSLSAAAAVSATSSAAAEAAASATTSAVAAAAAGAAQAGLDKKLVKLARWLGTKVLRLDSFIF
jgi:hypothetical protein